MDFAALSHIAATMTMGTGHEANEAMGQAHLSGHHGMMKILALLMWTMIISMYFHHGHGKIMWIICGSMEHG